MNDHYFSEQPNAASRPRDWNAELKGYSFRFTSDDGVFSKRGIDLGTKLLIEAFDMPEGSGPLLDVGCGYGPIGLVFAKICPSRKVIMVDVNERAVELTAKNAAANGADNVQVFQSDLFGRVPEADFSVIASNPPIRAGKKVIYKLFEDAEKHLAAEGEFWTVIRKQQGASSAVKKMREIFSDVTVVLKKKGYFVLKGTK